MYEDDPAAMLMSPHARGAEAHSPPCMPCAQGKVRDTYDLGDKVVIVTTDRQSAFDRLLASVPFKGQVGSWDGKDRNAYSVCGGPPPFPRQEPPPPITITRFPCLPGPQPDLRLVDEPHHTHREERTAEHP